MLIKRLSLFALMFVALWASSPAQAAPACADLFRRATLTERATAPVRRALEPVTESVSRAAKKAGASPLAKPVVIPAARIANELSSLVKRLKAPPFQVERFDFALDFYRRHGIDDVPRPKSPEARLAYIHYVANKFGRNAFDLEAWAHEATPEQFKALVKSIGRFNTDKGFSPSQIDAIYWKLFTYKASTPTALRKIARLSVENREINIIKTADEVFTQSDRTALEQWTTKELASHGAIEAFERLGLIQDQGLRGRMMDVLRANPNVTTNLVTGALMVIEKQLLGSPVSVPNISRLRVTKLASEIRTLVEEQGFDAAYPIIKKQYGHLAQFDRRYFFARRAMTVGLMTFMLSHMVPTVVQTVVPPHLLNSDMNAVQITKEVVNYYTDLTKAIVEDRVYSSGSPEAELAVRARNVPAKPHVELAKPNSVKALPKVDLAKVSENRVEITFDEQIAQENKPKGPPAKVPTSNLGSAEQTAKAIDENLDYLNSLDFSDPTNS